jgi:c-di-GMP-binding flagellar brake protein YcgR
MTPPVIIERLLFWGLAAVVVLLLALYLGPMLFRRWLTARYRALAAAQLAPPDVIRKGMKAILEMPVRGEEQRVARVLQSADTKTIALAVSRDEAPPVIGTPLRALLIGDGVAYRFHARVLDRREGQEGVILYITRPAWLERIQQRAYFRIPAGVPTTVTHLNSRKEEPPIYAALVRDISGGGLRLVLPVALPKGALIRVRMPISRLGEPAYEARVIFHQKEIHRERVEYVIGCEFIHLPEETRNLLINYCFDVQRRQRNRREKVDSRV